MDPNPDIIEINTESRISESFVPHSEIMEIDIASLIKRKLEAETQTEYEIPPVSIFHVPETMTTKKPEVYKPQQIGFGPHHGPEKARMEQRKRHVVEKMLQHYKVNDFKLSVVDKVLKIVPDIRECYEMLLQDDDASVARDFAIDGLFLLNLLQSYDSTSSRDRLLAPDITMVENQIPFMVLEQVDEALRAPSSGNTLSPSILRSFSEIHSPLELCSPFHAPRFCVHHLLDYMYRSILYNNPRRHAHQLLGASPFIFFYGAVFLEKLPLEKIGQLYEKIITSLQKFSKSNNTLASASKLQDRAGFRFRCLPKDEGIENIKIVGNCFYLPCITLNDDSDVILTNLVAYETLNPDSSRFPLSEYMGLMCWLVMDVEDVKILKMENIIKGDLGEDEVAKLFAELSLKTTKKSKLKGMIDEAIKIYEGRPMIRAYLFLKKLANWLLVCVTAIGSFVKAIWKVLAFLITIVTVMMLTYEAYCDVFGCDEENVMLLWFASS